MKIVTLLGSPHGLKGNTAGLLGYVLSSAEEEGALNETVVLKGDTVLPCMGCDVCHKKGLCVQKDDFEPLKEKIMAADGLILASPNYIFNVSAQLKAFMDRCCGVVHCMQFWGKYGVSVVTSGGDGGEAVSEYMRHFLITTGAVPVGEVSASMSVMPESGFTDEMKKSANSLGRRLVNAWKSGEVSQDIAEFRNEFRDRMCGLVDYRKEEWPYEYQHWKKMAPR